MVLATLRYFSSDFFGRPGHSYQDQPFLYIDDPQNIHARLGSRAQLSCRLFWKDAFGRAWIGKTPKVLVQWIINGFGFPVDMLESSFLGRLVVLKNQSQGIYELQINETHLEDEGSYACQAQILNEGLPLHRDVIKQPWNQTENQFLLGHSVMMFVRSKEAHLSIFFPPKTFGLFMSSNSEQKKLNTNVQFLIQNRLPLPEKLFVQAGNDLIFECISETSRPASQLEFSVNDKIITSFSKNLQHCQNEENSSHCVSDAYTYYGNGFHLQTRTIWKFSPDNEGSGNGWNTYCVDDQT
ncbi:hypothetical protein Aperf_G00000079025 [Anoplocephala perfoliata]